MSDKIAHIRMVPCSASGMEPSVDDVRAVAREELGSIETINVIACMVRDSIDGQVAVALHKLGVMSFREQVAAVDNAPSLKFWPPNREPDFGAEDSDDWQCAEGHSGKMDVWHSLDSKNSIGDFCAGHPPPGYILRDSASAGASTREGEVGNETADLPPADASSSDGNVLVGANYLKILRKSVTDLEQKLGRRNEEIRTLQMQAAFPPKLRAPTDLELRDIVDTFRIAEKAHGCRNDGMIAALRKAAELGYVAKIDSPVVNVSGWNELQERLSTLEAAMHEAGWEVGEADSAFILRLYKELQTAKEDAEESDGVCKRLTDILRRTALALKGPAPENVWHSWHDLPEVAAKLKSLIESDSEEVPDLYDLVSQREHAVQAQDQFELDFRAAVQALIVKQHKRVTVAGITSEAWGYAEDMAFQRRTRVKEK